VGARIFNFCLKVMFASWKSYEALYLFLLPYL
jgi:hypothetical protein